MGSRWQTSIGVIYDLTSLSITRVTAYVDRCSALADVEEAGLPVVQPTTEQVLVFEVVLRLKI